MTKMILRNLTEMRICSEKILLVARDGNRPAVLDYFLVIGAFLGVFWRIIHPDKNSRAVHLVCWTMIAFLLCLFPVTAGEIFINDNVSDTLSIHGDLVLYSKETPQEVTLFIHNLTSQEYSIIKSYSGQYTTSKSAAIGGDRIAWIYSTGYYNDNRSIILLNITTKEERAIKLEETTADNLQLDGDWLAWSSCKIRMYWTGSYEVSDRQCDLYGYNIVTHNKILVANMTDFQDQYSLDHGRIAFLARDIYLVELATGKKTQITNDNKSQSSPALSGDYLIWEEHPASGYEVYLYNIPSQKTSRITDNGSDPQIQGDYVAYRQSSRDGLALYTYSISTGKSAKITTSYTQPSEFALSKDYIVWRASHDVWRDRYKDFIYTLYAAPLNGGQPVTQSMTTATHEVRTTPSVGLSMVSGLLGLTLVSLLWHLSRRRS